MANVGIEIDFIILVTTLTLIIILTSQLGRRYYHIKIFENRFYQLIRFYYF